nr:sugar phosphate isomerase/epimerase family protein [Streptomyces sp. SID3343]
MAVLVDLGYDGVALALDHDHIAAYTDDPVTHVAAIIACLDEVGLAVVVGTDTYGPLDSRRAPAPTLVGADGAERRVDMLCRTVRFAAEIGSPVVSFRSGASEKRADPDVSWDRLLIGSAAVLDEAAVHGITLGLEPEPGAFVDTVEGYLELHRRLGGPEHLGLTLGLDAGGASAPGVGFGPGFEAGFGAEAGVECAADRIRCLAPHLVDVRIAEPGPPGRRHPVRTPGVIDDHPSVLSALHDIGYAGLIGVEPPPGPVSPETARSSLRALRAAAGRTPARR